jgi:hypothetical protein
LWCQNFRRPQVWGQSELHIETHLKNKTQQKGTYF